MKRDKNERGMEEVEDVESILMFTCFQYERIERMNQPFILIK